MKEQFECPYCGEHFNRPERYLKPSHTFFVVTQMYCFSCKRKWLEYGIEKPVYLGYSLPENIEFNDDTPETKLIFPYKNTILSYLMNYLLIIKKEGTEKYIEEQVKKYTNGNSRRTY